MERVLSTLLYIGTHVANAYGLTPLVIANIKTKFTAVQNKRLIWEQQREQQSEIMDTDIETQHPRLEDSDNGDDGGDDGQDVFPSAPPIESSIDNIVTTTFTTISPPDHNDTWSSTSSISLAML